MMKLIQKTVSLFILMAVVATAQPHGGVRALAKPSLVKAAGILLKNPTFIMAAGSAMSFGIEKYCQHRLNALNDGTYSEDNAARLGKYTMMKGWGEYLAPRLLALSANHLLISRMKTVGRLPKLSNKTALTATSLALLGLESIHQGRFLEKDQGLSDFGKKFQPHHNWFMNAGREAIMLSAVYLTLA